MSARHDGLYFLHCLTATHLGSGQSAGVIDQPVQREAATGLPVAPGSEVKGALRDQILGADDTGTTALFGPEPGAGKELFRGALTINDACLLCLPIRTMVGGFAWVASPLVLLRLRRDLDFVSDELKKGLPKSVPMLDGKAHALASSTAAIRFNDQVLVHDLNLACARDEGLHAQWAAWIATQVFAEEAWRGYFKERFLIVHDDVFDCLATIALEVRARIQLNPGTRTVKHGPWYEESLPAESLLWGLYAIEGPYGPGGDTPKVAQLRGLLPARQRMQIGGSATVGRGQVYWIAPAGYGQTPTASNAAQSDDR